MLRVLTLPELYVYFTLCFAHFSINKLLTNSSFHYFNNARKKQLLGTTFKQPSFQKNNMYLSTKLYNSLPSYIKEHKELVFKTTLKKILINECLYSIDEFYEIEWRKYVI